MGSRRGGANTSETADKDGHKSDKNYPENGVSR